MSTSAEPLPRGTTLSRSRGNRVRVHILLAALAMVATLPGRTHGLGLITEPLLAELNLSRIAYANVNLYATLFGALFCLPVGYLIDRLGPRVVLTGVVATLGGVVIAMCGLSAGWGVWLVPGLFVLVTLTRGLGQSALSVVSLALLGKSAGRHSGLAYGVYSFVIAIGFMAAFAACKYALETWHADWRTLWTGIGATVLLFAFPSMLLVRPALLATDQAEDVAEEREGPSLTLGQALGTSTFWVFGLATSLYGLVASGISLFNQSILAERGFDRGVFLTIAMVSPMIGLASNLLTGVLGQWISPGRLLTVAMLLLAGSLALFPLVKELWQVYAYAIAMGIAGGMVTVIFFAIWARAFGKRNLGKIQGAAQMLTVLASAVGPLLLAVSKDGLGSYVPLFYCLAPLCGALGIAAWFTPGTATQGPEVKPPGRAV